MVDTWADDELRGAVRAALDKIEAVLPETERERMKTTALYSLSFNVPERMRTNMQLVRHAIDDRTTLELTYEDREGEASERRVRPLALYFWGKTWTLAAWCELRNGYRNFRLDRIEQATPGETFELVSPVTIEDYVRAMTADHEG